VAHRALFDSDSFDILVDGGATASISNCLANFIQPPTTTNIRIKGFKGFNGTYSAARIGSVWWPILDDEGVRHVLQIPDTYFVASSCPMMLLSPQHYSQQIHDHRGTYSTSFGDQAVFVFHKKKFQVTIPLSPSSNVGILRSAPGHQIFSCFVEDAKPPKEPPPAIFASTVITDDEADDMELQEETESVSTAEDETDNVILRGDFAVRPLPDFAATSVRPSPDFAATSVHPSPENIAPAGFKGGSEVRPPVDIFPTENVCPSTVPNNSVNPSGTSSGESDEPDRPNVIPFDLDNDQEDTNLTNQDDITSSLDASAELMRWHLRLGHLPFAYI
jgi:hypothetical protein